MSPNAVPHDVLPWRFPCSFARKGPPGLERTERTRDVSFRGLYFNTEQEYRAGEQIEFVLTLPREITQASDVRIRCFGQIMRVELENHGVAARIERYEFLPTPA